MGETLAFIKLWRCYSLLLGQGELMSSGGMLSWCSWCWG